MPRSRSARVTAVKSSLIARIADGLHRPGERFLSTRAVAQRFGISFQTAHRVISELQAEGYLQRRPSSGTYIAGLKKSLRQAELWFHPRARREGSYGAHLLHQLLAELRRKGISHRVCWPEASARPAENSYPVIWELAEVLDWARTRRQRALLLNDVPAPGLAANLIDAVTTDDYSAGICAAQALQPRPSGRGCYVAVAGPAADRRSRRRIEGFCSGIPRARVVSAGGWYFEDGLRVAKRVLAFRPDAVFCVNDRLAEALLAYCREHHLAAPRIVGHDNAPVAETCHLTTIATPWEEMVATAGELIRSRLEDYAGTASHVTLAQQLVRRLSA